MMPGLALGERETPYGYGEWAERYAEAFLQRSGWSILDRRYRIRRGEIDLIALDGNTVVFVEVKARRAEARYRPADTVTSGKQRHLARAALAYLQRRRLLDRACRFDVIEVVGDQRLGATVRHLIDAFRPNFG